MQQEPKFNVINKNITLAWKEALDDILATPEASFGLAPTKLLSRRVETKPAMGKLLPTSANREILLSAYTIWATLENQLPEKATKDTVIAHTYNDSTQRVLKAQY